MKVDENDILGFADRIVRPMTRARARGGGGAALPGLARVVKKLLAQRRAIGTRPAAPPLGAKPKILAAHAADARTARPQARPDAGRAARSRGAGLHAARIHYVLADMPHL